jgi:hypothetical protein
MIRPEVRRAFATGDAKRIWQNYGLRAPSDLNLEDLAWAMGVVVRDASLPSALARLIRHGQSGLIRVKQGIRWPGQRRFAIAHEIGHWCMHAKISQLLACTDADMRAQYKDSQPEAEANWFAAELLMPEHLFRPAINGTTPIPDVINGLAGQFDVTRTAASVRYVDLCKESCIFVMCKNGRIKWWRCTGDLEGPLWLKHGSELSPRTLAGKYFAGKPLSSEVQSVSMDEWADRHPDWADEALEAVIPLGQTGAAIAMIWLE